MINNFIILGLFLLAIISGMLGLGVAFVAVPFLSFFLPDLVNQVQPLSLTLNGLTALFAMFGFAKSGYIDWKKAASLDIVTTITAPFGAYLVHFITPLYIWFIYLAAVIFLAYRLFKPVSAKEREENFKLALILAVPISILKWAFRSGSRFSLIAYPNYPRI